MGGLWIWVGLLAAVLLGLHWRYTRRGLKDALAHWRQVQEALSQRHALLADIIRTSDAPPAQTEAVARSLKRIGERNDVKLKQLRQRCAVEFRLAADSRKVIENAGLDEDRRTQLKKTDRAVQSALAMYDIAERSYNRRLEGFPGAIVAMLGGFSHAPALDIEPVIHDPEDE